MAISGGDFAKGQAGSQKLGPNTPGTAMGPRLHLFLRATACTLGLVSFGHREGLKKCNGFMKVRMGCLYFHSKSDEDTWMQNMSNLAY